MFLSIVPRAALLAALVFSGASACSDDAGKDPGDTKPVDVTPVNLDGYWVEVGPQGDGPVPALIHFGVEPLPGETTAGAPMAELVGDFDSVQLWLGSYTVRDGRFELTPLNGGGALRGTIERLTGSELDISFIGTPTRTFVRTSGCGGPGYWTKPVWLQDAAWDPDGGLHLLMTRSGAEPLTKGYAYLPPGRCTPYVPPLGPTGDSIDVGPDGTIYIVRSRGATGPAGAELRLYQIPKRPWTRAALEDTGWISEEPLHKASAAPPTRVAVDDNGEVRLWWAYAGLHSTRMVDGELVRDELTPSSPLAQTPAMLTVKYLRTGGFLVRSGYDANGAIFEDGVWREWHAETVPGGDGTVLGGIASAFDIAADGTLYAAWRTGDRLLGEMMLGRLVDGEWEVIDAGRGDPLDMRVQDDGSVDVVSRFHRHMAWSHVPPGFAPRTWTQALPLSSDGSATLAPSHSPVAARFGPDGEILVRSFVVTDFQGLWTSPRVSGYVPRMWQEIAITFDAETPLTLEFPTLGVSCSADCVVLAPPSVVLPVEIIGGPETTAPRLGGGGVSPSAAGDGRYWTVTVLPTRDVNGKRLQMTLAVEARVRRLEVAPLGPAEGRSAIHGVDRNAAGEAVALWSAEAPSVSVWSPGEAPRTVALEGASLTAVQGRDMLRALAGGGYVVGPVLHPSLPAGKNGAVFLDESLAVEAVVAMDVIGGGASPGGFIGLAWNASSGAIDLVGATADGLQPARPTKLRDAGTVMVLGDGIVTYSDVNLGLAEDVPGTVEEHVWRRIGADGAVMWTLRGPRGPTLVQNVDGDDLVLMVRYAEGWTIGGVALGRAESEEGGIGVTSAIVRIDGATGQVVAHRVGGFGRVDAPSDVALVADGLVLVTNATLELTLTHVPWDAAKAPFDVSYARDALGVNCLTTQCTVTAAPARGDGKSSVVLGWVQPYPTDYEGERVESNARRAVVGLFTVAP